MSVIEKVAREVSCMACATKAKAGKRLPRSWKRKGDDIYCDLCWSQRYLLRAITVPVVSPLDSTWPELRTVLREMWAAATQASNWILTELYARDVRRRDEKKMPPMPNIYLYPEVRERFPQLPSQTVAALENTIKATYRAKRYEVLWTVKSSLPVYRYPTPFPVPPVIRIGDLVRSKACTRAAEGMEAGIIVHDVVGIVRCSDRRDSR
jgi:hypothetical protein